jgi:hypothetical protein
MSASLRNTQLLVLAAAALFGSTIASISFAATAWEKAHPRRDQVNDRLEHQNARIHHEVKEGDLTKSQAAALHTEDRQIRGEEHAMASQNGGHITRSEQKVLNQQENAVSKQIGK